MKKILTGISVFIGIAVSTVACAADPAMRHDEHMHQMHQMHAEDARISLGLAPQMKQHQLSNMREHMQAIQTITGLLAESKFAEASEIASTQLGSTPEMLSMCSMMGNENFEKLGLAFHKSGDDLGAALKSGDMKASLRALDKTMQYCVECHATYRQ